MNDFFLTLFTVLTGEKGASAHAMSTGHTQFVEKR